MVKSAADGGVVVRGRRQVTSKIRCPRRSVRAIGRSSRRCRERWDMAKQIPDGFHSVNSAITVRDGVKMLEFYRQAFGAEELMRMPGPDGKSLMHGEVKIGDSVVMISDEQPGGCRSPLSVGASTSYLYVYVPDVDKTFNQAVRAGAKVGTPGSDMFWGDRLGHAASASGPRWGLATNKKAP